MAKKKESKSRYVTRTFTMPDGKRKYVYGKTKAEADAKVEANKSKITAAEAEIKALQAKIETLEKEIKALKA